MKFFRELMYKFNRFMQGRYGYDELFKFLTYTALVLVVLSYLPYMKFLSLVAFILMVYGIFRVFSKNFTDRRNELNKYYILSDKFKKSKRVFSARWRDRKTHIYFKCKNCGAIIRVPKNKGEIEVTCPRCRAKTTKKT